MRLNGLLDLSMETTKMKVIDFVCCNVWVDQIIKPDSTQSWLEKDCCLLRLLEVVVKTFGVLLDFVSATTNNDAHFASTYNVERDKEKCQSQKNPGQHHSKMRCYLIFTLSSFCSLKTNSFPDLRTYCLIYFKNIFHIVLFGFYCIFLVKATFLEAFPQCCNEESLWKFIRRWKHVRRLVSCVIVSLIIHRMLVRNWLCCLLVGVLRNIF